MSEIFAPPQLPDPAPPEPGIAAAVRFKLRIPPKPAPVRLDTARAVAASSASGMYGCTALEKLWVRAGGSRGVKVNMASIAEAESGGRPAAHNPSGASGLWQILGQVVPGNVYNPLVNAKNAVRKYKDAASAFRNGYAPWTTWPAAAGRC